jgi:hypothetical protein
MRYEKPQMTEIKMDAEIGSYQNDFDPMPPVDRVEDRDDERDQRAE